MRRNKIDIYRIVGLSRTTVRARNRDIHSLLEETIAERKKILPKWEGLFAPRMNTSQKDIHQQLAETISALKSEGRRWMSRH